tara:strand:+ start:352 stop:525 length:174 start_codon:yes stop_codon:yes gene_type:complete
MLNNFVANELDKLFKTDYYGTEEQIENENLIVSASAIPMTDEETIEEYYLKVYDLTK